MVLAARAPHQVRSTKLNNHTLDWSGSISASGQARSGCLPIRVRRPERLADRRVQPCLRFPRAACLRCQPIARGSAFCRHFPGNTCAGMRRRTSDPSVSVPWLRKNQQTLLAHIRDQTLALIEIERDAFIVMIGDIIMHLHRKLGVAAQAIFSEPKQRYHKACAHGLHSRHLRARCARRCEW